MILDKNKFLREFWEKLRRKMGEFRQNSDFRRNSEEISGIFVRKWRKILEFRGNMRIWTEITSFLGGNADLQEIFEDFRRNVGENRRISAKYGMSADFEAKIGILSEKREKLEFRGIIRIIVDLC